MTDPLDIDLDLADLDPGARQRVAADPARSIWVAASAGTGKTKVLTDRVLTLLLTGTPPSRLLCLTFTKAAAAEMANRVNDRLSAWATHSDSALRDELMTLTGKPPEPETAAAARRLFARVLDSPGGMRIETIHAFCQSLLRRFPLEADVAPHFELMDDRTQAELVAQAQAEMVTAARAEPDSPLARALAEVTGHVQESGFTRLLSETLLERGRVRELIAGPDGHERFAGLVRACLGLPPGETEAAFLAKACEDAAFDAAGLRRVVGVLAESTKSTDLKHAAAIAPWLAHAERRVAEIEAYLDVFVTGKGEPRKTLATKEVLKANPWAEESLRAEQERLIAFCARRAALVVAGATTALIRVAGSVLDRYDTLKRRRGLLDYDDLILAACRLLSTPGVAPWVLFKLDGGIDHILIDEAQDTNPDQWQIVRALAEEFFSGLGAREPARTIFAVGDAKQSIYSFQRADPAAFIAMRDHFKERVHAAEGRWNLVPLDVSFRSTEAVLALVDAVFARPEARAGVAIDDLPIRHAASRVGQAGLVELWPVIEPDEADEPPPWEPPVEQHLAEAPSARLAGQIAATIRDWLDRGERLESRDRPIQPGDIMILVRRRGGFVEDVVRALKQRRIPVAGADRMVLTEQLAVMDLLALGRFLLMPEDDLTLATVLKGPLIGLEEDELFALAHHRGEVDLWRELRRRGAETPRFEAAHRFLADLLAEADYRPPYELFAEVLGPRQGRKRLIGRLGLQANDAIDEFLAQTLAYEAAHVPSLQGFLAWLDRGELEAKRDPDPAGRNEVRIMTVHGAKGLQAPIVFLPDTVAVPTQVPSLLWPKLGPEKLGSEKLAPATGPLLWVPARGQGEPVAAAAREAACRRRDDEYRRLLYVALTRAADRLYIGGWRTKRAPAGGSPCWYDMIAAGMADLTPVEEIAAFDTIAQPPGPQPGLVRRYACRQQAAPVTEPPRASLDASPPALPAWIDAPPPPEPAPPRPLVASRPSLPDPAVLSPLAADDGRRFRRGLIVHRLLQTLPDLPRESVEAATRRYLASPAHDLDPVEQAAIARETLAVLADPDFAPIFGPGSRAEVPVVGLIEGRVISGRIDRLVVTDAAVLIVDYKTNRPPPRHQADIAPLYREQLRAYRAALAAIYPGRPVRAALLWTDGPRLMPVDLDS
ncbi:MAG TPA: double-strand break repair helicase AddA [Stellaceae bacterium]|nr:double-strand break repair helicase AddA [Stellaceae bacterium]